MSEWWDRFAKSENEAEIKRLKEKLHKLRQQTSKIKSFQCKSFIPKYREYDYSKN